MGRSRRSIALDVLKAGAVPFWSFMAEIRSYHMATLEEKGGRVGAPRLVTFQETAMDWFMPTTWLAVGLSALADRSDTLGTVRSSRPSRERMTGDRWVRRGCRGRRPRRASLVSRFSNR